jgi:hypothetical protein
MALATERGKEYALEQLKKRREKNKDIKKVDNASLYAGSPMYYYCRVCDEEMKLPETHTCAAPTLCEECKALRERGWLLKDKRKS